MVRIFHTADIHLDAPFSLRDPAEAERRRTGLRSAFCSLIHKARMMEADLFLIAGDLFEDRFVTRDTAEIVMREIASFSSCRFFITPGNHDPYHEASPYRLLKWPENVHIFTDEAVSYVDIPEKNVRVYGHAYHTNDIPDDLFSGFRVEDESRINILVAHGFVNMPLSSCNVLMRADLENSGLDYAALGHVHAHGGFEKYGRTLCAYAGCPVGRSFDECGRKVAIAGTIDKNEQNLTTMPASDRHFEIVKADVTGSRSKDELLETVKQACAACDGDTALRILLTGSIAPGAAVTKDEIAATVRAPFYLELQDDTMPLLDAEALKNDGTLLGAFYRQLESRLCSADADERKKAALALRYGLAALRGNDLHLD